MCDFVSDLKDFVAKTNPQVSRVVGQGGLSVTLDKMQQHGFAVHIDVDEKHIFRSTDFLFQERLYDFVFAVTRKQRDLFAKELDGLVKKWNLVSHILGSTQTLVN